MVVPLHGTPAEHKAYADYNQKKGEWHLQRWGNPKQPQAKLEHAGRYLYRAAIARAFSPKED